MPETYLGRETETEPEELGFHELLSEVARERTSDELKSNRTATELLFALREEKFPEAPEREAISPFSLLTELVDSRQGPLRERLLGLKLDLVDYIDSRIGVGERDPTEREVKQKRYKQAMERLFEAMGRMKPGEEYGMLTSKLESATPEEIDPERRALMERRKKELKEVYGIKGGR